DLYFDNVGGGILDAVLGQIALRARVVLCGAISRYNETERGPGPKNYFNLTLQRGRMEGFIVLDYAAKMADAGKQLLEWERSGKLVHKEDVQKGIENAPRTLQRLFRSENFGRQLLRLAESGKALPS
ncbi:MAG: NADP-dependent oxidoreductase, partial [Myxococcales bacterium]|nr:NADP-dependent oxidoreductase [Myxococcales bacterium]